MEFFAFDGPRADSGNASRQNERSLISVHVKASNVGTSKSMSRAKYGIDAPGLVHAHLILGSLLALMAAIGLAWPKPNPVPLSLSIGAAAAAVLLLMGASVMLRSSLVSKKRVCDRLVAALALSGNESVLDAGCGRGLALIGCAKKLTTGKAIGIDLWAAKDLSNNIPTRRAPTRRWKAWPTGSRWKPGILHGCRSPTRRSTSSSR